MPTHSCHNTGLIQVILMKKATEHTLNVDQSQLFLPGASLKWWRIKREGGKYMYRAQQFYMLTEMIQIHIHI